MKKLSFRAAAVAALMLTGLLVTAAPAAAAQGVDWKPCPSYSDEVIKARFGPEKIAQFRALWARTECGTISVPLDYRYPNGRRIEVGITRLKARDQKHRLGSLALNPGGPGASGYLMPHEVVMINPTDAKLNERYDLVGFDPRGVGYSTQAQCKMPGGKPSQGPLTEEQAREMFTRMVAGLKTCSESDPAFLGQVTTQNVARDLDRIRAGLGERKLSFLGVSWGTWLGVVYRSMFPQRVSRMWLDSVALPDPRMDVFEEVRAAAVERDFERMATWLAKHDAGYGFGATAQQVKTALLAMIRRFDAQPKKFTDIETLFDGGMVSQLSAQQTTAWEIAAKALKELRDATGDMAPPTIKEIFGGPPGGPPPADMPQEFNPTANTAIFCNGDTGPRYDFAQAWAAYQRRLANNPVTGRGDRFSVDCSGWTLPVQAVQLRRSNGSLVLSGHLYETLSPYEWTWDMWRETGGTVVTVNDDIHASVLFEENCGSKLVEYSTRAGPHANARALLRPSSSKKPRTCETGPGLSSGGPNARLFQLARRSSDGRISMCRWSTKYKPSNRGVGLVVAQSLSHKSPNRRVR